MQGRQSLWRLIGQEGWNSCIQIYLGVLGPLLLLDSDRGWGHRGLVPGGSSPAVTMAWAEGQLGFAGGESVPHPMQGCPVLDRWAGWILGDMAGGRSRRGLSPAGLRQTREGILGWMRRPGPAVEQEVGQPAPGEPCYFRVRHGHGRLGGKLEGREGTRIAWGTGKTTLALRPSVGCPVGTGWVHLPTIMSPEHRSTCKVAAASAECVSLGRRG